MKITATFDSLEEFQAFISRQPEAPATEVKQASEAAPAEEAQEVKEEAAEKPKKEKKEAKKKDIFTIIDFPTAIVEDDEDEDFDMAANL